MTTTPKPHEMLEGLHLGDDWHVSRMIPPKVDATGGHFSCGYLVENRDGQRAYLKALDFFSGLPTSPDPARDLEPMIRAFNHERDLLARCRSRRFSHVVNPLFDGTIQVPNVSGPATVHYIAFELAGGDIREQMTRMQNADRFDCAWALRALHNIALGLTQLHGVGIAHQDTKPSNILCYDDLSKVADLGSAASRDRISPRDDCDVAGDLGYAPPELLYGAAPPQWERRRFGCDLYHCGSMVSFVFAFQSMTPLLLSYLPDEQMHWRRWSGTFGEILPYLRTAFSQALASLERELPESCRTDLLRIIRELCDPDPIRRGHPRERIGAGNPYSLRRYVTEFDLLAKRAEKSLLGRV